MPNNEEAQSNFGCEHCWPATPDAAWKSRAALDRVSELIDESHFHVMILACPKCTQRFVSVFTEEVDLIMGEDPQYWTLLPLTDRETGELQQDNSVTEPKLDALGPNRRSLRRDHPKDSEPVSYWSTGVSVGFHD